MYKIFAISIFCLFSVAGCDLIDEQFEKKRCKEELASPEPAPFNCEKHMETSKPTTYADGSTSGGLIVSCAAMASSHQAMLDIRKRCRYLLNK